MPWYLYIAQARTGRYYVGITTEPARRIRDHNQGKGARMAVNQGPFTLVYTSPPLPNQSVARKQEIQVKSWNRAKKKRLINGEVLWLLTPKKTNDSLAIVSPRKICYNVYLW